LQRFCLFGSDRLKDMIPSIGNILWPSQKSAGLLRTSQCLRQAVLLLVIVLISVGCRSSSQRPQAKLVRIDPGPIALSEVPNSSTQPDRAMPWEVQPAQFVEAAAPISGTLPEPAVPQTETLWDIESLTALAMQHNPAIREAEAAVHKAMGFRRQVQLYPNPNVGYNGSQLFDKQTDQHFLFVEQDFVRGNKLEHNSNVLGLEVESLKWSTERQRRAVESDVKQLFYATLSAQQEVAITDQFVDLATQSMKLTQKRKVAGEASEIDVLQSEIQLQQFIVTQQQANARLRGAWLDLAANVGLPDIACCKLEGELPEQPIQFNWQVEYERLCQSSPEIQSAVANVNRASANISRQRVQAIPNVSVMVGVGYDRSTESQMANTQVGIPFPRHNQNEGNLSAAQAEFCRATHELERIRLSIKSRLAQASQEYESAAASVNIHRDEILPKSKRMQEVSDITYKAGEIDFLQVLTVRRTSFDASLNYLIARRKMAQAQVSIEEFLLSGSLNHAIDTSFDAGLRDQTLSGQ
jgi:outer membrane protein, heavy metal efflux system